MSPKLPPLDLHAHINPKTRTSDLERLGAVVFAATRSLEEYESVRSRRDQVTIWGIGCHPGVSAAQQDYDSATFTTLLMSTPLVSEIGLDRRSKVPLEEQERVFDSILSALQCTPRIASIHSAGAPGRVIDALERTSIKGAVLHWWRGDEDQTQRAVELGCWFSVNAAGVSHPNDVALMPLERILTETDHPSGNRASLEPRQPGSVGEIEDVLARLHGISPAVVRQRVWANLVGLVDETAVESMLPLPVRRMLIAARSGDFND